MTPRPRPGAAGIWDRLIGPGATAAESLLTSCWAVTCAAAAVAYALLADLGWSPLQFVVVAAIALDVGGGVAELPGTPR